MPAMNPANDVPTAIAPADTHHVRERGGPVVRSFAPTRGVRRVSAAIALTVVVLLAGVSVAVAQGAPTMGVTPAEAAVGESITVSGDGCVFGSEAGDVDVTAFGSTTRTSADDSGSWSTTIAVPVDAPLGSATIAAICVAREPRIGAFEYVPAATVDIVAPVPTESTSTTTAPIAPPPPAVPSAPAYTG